MIHFERYFQYFNNHTKKKNCRPINIILGYVSEDLGVGLYGWKFTGFLHREIHHRGTPYDFISLMTDSHS